MPFRPLRSRMPHPMRPAHFTHFPRDRKAASNFFRKNLGMKIVRHWEMKGQPKELCPTNFRHCWSKTCLAFGPENTSFAVQMLYFYQDVAAVTGNEVIGACIKSVRVLARAKATCARMITVEKNRIYDVLSPTGRVFRLVDEPAHRCMSDPVSEIHYRTHKYQETLSFWHETLGVELYSLGEKEFTLFFGNYRCKLKFIEESGEITRGHGFLCLTAPFNYLKTIAETLPASAIFKPLERLQHHGRDADYLIILQDPNSYNFWIYDEETFYKYCCDDPIASSRFDLSVMYEHLIDRSPIPFCCAEYN